MTYLRASALWFSILLLIGFFANLNGEDASDYLKQSGETSAPKKDATAPNPTVSSAPEIFNSGEIHRVYRVPITEAISKPNLYILRRSLKQAIEEEVDVIVIDMDTPGGRLDVTFDMMELLDRFEGETITFVNKDAISAGAYIAMATDAIYFAPNGVMGAAAVVSGSGGEIDESMKAKINSYLLARMRSYTEEHPYRAEVIRAMADLEYELKIDDTVLKKTGELLSLTASEAVINYGNPPRPLLAVGIADSVDDLLTERYGKGNFEVKTFSVSWSEEVAKYLDAISPILLGIGFLALFIEFKTPGFGIFGISGIILVGIVFVSNYVAGLAGMEAMIFFVLGLLLIVIDIFLLPGTFILMLIGLAMAVGSIIWSLGDFWPTVPQDGIPFNFTVENANLWGAFYEVLGAFAVAFIGLALVWKILPTAPIYGKLVNQGSGSSPDPAIAGGGSRIGGPVALPDIGSIGVVTKTLHPSGEIKIDERYYEATVGVGTLERGETVKVVGYRSFALLVAKEKD